MQSPPNCPLAFLNANLAQMRQNSTSLEADVTCDTGYAWNEEGPQTLECQAGGGWQGGRCVQKLWQGQEAARLRMFRLPRPPKVGWAVCLQGRPTENNEFAIILDKDGKNQPFQLRARIDARNQTYFTRRVNTIWDEKIVAP